MTTNGFGRLTTSARAVPEPINEAAFQRMIMDLARYNGWRVYHTHDSRRSEPGFPDLVIARVRRVIAERDRQWLADGDWGAV
jgi:hypothetical protein